MTKLNNLKPEAVVRAFERAGWKKRKSPGSHVTLTKRGNRNILTVPVHKGKPVKQGLLRKLIKDAGITVEKFLQYYK